MTRYEARNLAEKITNQELFAMFNVARVLIRDWTQVAKINKSMSKGAAWNILARDFDINRSYNTLTKSNMIREFGEFLPTSMKPIKKQRGIVIIHHQEPNFENEIYNQK